MRPFQDEFSAAAKGLYFNKDSAVQLSLGDYTPSADRHYYSYNFLTRTLAVTWKNGVSVVPFSQLDPETLACMHAKLVELGGTPPSLPPTPAGFGLIRKIQA